MKYNWGNAISPHIYGHLIFDKEAKVHRGEKTHLQQMGAGQNV